MIVLQVVIVTSSHTDFTIISSYPLLHRLHAFCIATSDPYYFLLPVFTASVFITSLVLFVSCTSSVGVAHLNQVGSPPTQSRVHIQSAQLTIIMWSSYTRSGVTRSLLFSSCMIVALIIVIRPSLPEEGGSSATVSYHSGLLLQSAQLAV